MNTDGYQLVGDNLVLDLLEIAYTDLTNNIPTDFGKLIRIINRLYPHKVRNKINHTMTTLTDSNWFKKKNNNIVLTERGVEFYLQLSQFYHFKQDIENSKQESERATLFAIISILLTLISFVVTYLIEKYT